MRGSCATRSTDNPWGHQMTTDVILKAIPIGISLVAVTISFFALLRQAGESQRSRNLLTVSQVLKEFRGEELQEHRRCLGELISGAIATDGSGYIDPEVWTHLRPLIHYYDSLGLLMAYDAVDERPILAYLGLAIMDTWALSADFVRERRRSRTEYMAFFEHAAARAAKERLNSIRGVELERFDESDLPSNRRFEPTPQARHADAEVD